MEKEQIVSGTITIEIPFRKTFCTSTDDNEICDYIENHIMDYIEDIDEKSIRILDTEIEDVEIQEHYEEEDYYE